MVPDRLTIAPITSTVRGLAVEIPVGERHGLDHDSVINFDNITTVHRDVVGKHIGYLSDAEDWARCWRQCSTSGQHATLRSTERSARRTQRVKGCGDAL